ncbi:MAG: 16S rRNA (adenine(1518)-N(6)/adenine(1519)-N(6))-dimethyltransferase RsmA [Candidatus Dojkabacteria bacterium]
MKPKRALGQNFFINKNLGDHIINTLVKSNSKGVLEIGPGLGFFTERLIKVFNDLIVVEKDNALAKNLQLLFPNIRVINEDFLDLELDTFKDITYFGSLPYNVSKPIIKKIIQSNTFKNPAYFIIQKEVAEKYIYIRPYNILSLTTAIYADVKKLLDISPSSFKPQPNVESSLVVFYPKKEIFGKYAELEKLITMAFKQPRKTLKNNLKGTKYINLEGFESARAEELSLDNYISILLNNSC